MIIDKLDQISTIKELVEVLDPILTLIFVLCLLSLICLLFIVAYFGDKVERNDKYIKEQEQKEKVKKFLKEYIEENGENLYHD